MLPLKPVLSSDEMVEHARFQQLAIDRYFNNPVMETDHDADPDNVEHLHDETSVLKAMETLQHEAAMGLSILQDMQGTEEEASAGPGRGVEDIVQDQGEDEPLELEPNLTELKDFIVKSPAYNWLLGTLQRESEMDRATPDVMADIRATILGALPSLHKVSRRAPSKGYQATFELLWNPLLFVDEQRYTETPREALERAITLTGSTDDAQAATTGSYLGQTWPSNGNEMMEFVKGVVELYAADHPPTTASGPLTSHRTLSDGTSLDGRIEGEKFIVTATGTGDSLAEVGQQLAWLGAALRTSPFSTGVAQSVPRIHHIGLLNNAGNYRVGYQSDIASQRSIPHILCVIAFDVTQPTTITPDRFLGHCWHSMFRNPVMVTGYPIRSKGEHSLGLELPLNLMASMAGSNRAVEFNDNLIIKGFSTMLIATKMTRDLIIWHYLFNAQGERISYLDHNMGTELVTLADMDNKPRHVVGWCFDCAYCAGAPDARYNIGRTGLPRPHAGCLLEKISISGGKIITGGATFAVGVKDTPIHLTRNGYIPNLKWIATKYVVLWDTADRRGWLVKRYQCSASPHTRLALPLWPR